MTPEEQAAADAAAAKAKADADAAAAKAKADADAAAAKAKADADALEAEKKKTFEYDYVKKLRDEAAEARRAATDAETARKAAAEKVAEYERKELEAQGKHKEAADAAEERAKKAETKAEEVQAKADKRYIDAEIKLEAQKAGAVDPGDVLLFIDREGIKLDGSDVVGAAEAVAKLKDSKKHLFQQQGTLEEENPARGRRVAPARSVKAGEKIDSFKLDDKEFQAAWESAGKRAA